MRLGLKWYCTCVDSDPVPAAAPEPAPAPEKSRPDPAIPETDHASVLEAAAALADFEGNLAGLLAAARGGAERAAAVLAPPQEVTISAQAVYARGPSSAPQASGLHMQPQLNSVQPAPRVAVTPFEIEKAQREAIAAVKNSDDSELSHLREVIKPS